MAAKPGLQVQKYGRTTRLTVGEVEAVNASINVTYGSAGSQVARFVGQIMVCCNFSQGGDSGSLIVARDLDRDGNAGRTTASRSPCSSPATAGSRSRTRSTSSSTAST